MNATQGSAPDNGNLRFTHLPLFASYLLEHKLHELVAEQLRMARTLDLPIMKHFAFMTKEQLTETSIKNTGEFLVQIAGNMLEKYVQESTERWVNNYLPIVTRDQILAEDLTLIHYLRKTCYSKFIPGYTQDVNEALAILHELDIFVQYSESVSIRTFVQIQQEQINAINSELQRHKEQLLEAQEIAGIGSFEWDLAGGGNSTFTPQVYRIFEMEETSNLNEFLQYVHPDDRDNVTAAVRAAMEGIADYDCEYRYSRNGKDKIVWSRGIVEFVDGNATVMRGTVMDVTSRHELVGRLQQTGDELARLNISLLEKNQELERSNKELSEFSYVASHDLQEPLRKIQTFSGRILEKEHDALSVSGRDFFARIQKSAARMQTLIDDLLLFSHTHNPITEITPVDLEALAGEIRTTYAEAIAEGKMTIESEGLPVIDAVTFQVRQLFDNLVSNAVKYNKPGQPAAIKLRADKVSGAKLGNGADKNRTYCKISVADNGIGFEQKYAERIFEMFQRLNGKDEYPGTGIGLSICKKIAENHGGFITAKGKPGEGATFEVYLPC